MRVSRGPVLSMTMTGRCAKRGGLVLLGVLSLATCRPPTPVVAAVDVMPGTVADAHRTAMTELVAAFDRAEAAVNRADLDGLMAFYSPTYNYHGLKIADVRRIWAEVFTHYGSVTSTHAFTELRLVRTGGVRKAFVTCTGGLYGTEKQTGKPVTIDSWSREVHHLVHENGAWRFYGNAGGTAPSAPPASAPHHPLF